MAYEITPERRVEMRIKREAEELERYLDNKECRGRKYVSQCGYSDVHPFEVIKEVSATTVEVRAMHTVQTKTPSDFHPGGFHGHYADNREGQEYTYHSDEENGIRRIRWSERNNVWRDASGARYYFVDKPYKHYDYNF